MKSHKAQDPASPPSKRLKLKHPTASETMAANQVVVDLTESPPNSQFSSMPAQSNSVRVAKTNQPSSFTGPKRLVTKNNRNVLRADSDQYFDQVWSQLEAALSAIFRGMEVPYSTEDLYKGVENLCRQAWGFLLYKQLSEKCKNELTSLLKVPIREEAKRMEASGVLLAVVRAWSVWSDRLVS